MKQVLAAIYMFVAAVAVGFGVAYVVRSTPETRLGHWTKIRNVFDSTVASVRSYFTGLFAGRTSNTAESGWRA
jgi:hypothetical protein